MSTLNNTLADISRSQSRDDFRRDRIKPVTETATPAILLMLDHLQEMNKLLAEMNSFPMCKNQAD